MKKLMIVSLLALLLFPALVFASNGSDSLMTKLVKTKDLLYQRYKEYIDSGVVREVYLYPLALARIDEALDLYKSSPKASNTRQQIELADMLAEAALNQMTAAMNYSMAFRLQEETEKTFRQIATMREEINTLQQNQAVEEAHKLQMQIAMQQQEIERQREEAQQRFDQLKSELISVRQDARGTIISMSDILFDVNQATLTSDLKINLAKITGILLVYKDLNITIEGHTDNTGSRDYNQTLSENRAENVLTFLTEQGVSPTRLSSTGYGFDKPVADNNTAEGRRKNRRVDLVIR